MKLGDGDRLELIPGAQVQAAADGALLARVRGQTARIEGIERELCRALLAAVDGEKSVGDVLAGLAARFDRQVARVALEALTGSLFRRWQGAMAPGGLDARIVVIGNGTLAEAIATGLSDAGWSAVEARWVPALEHGVDAERMLTPLPMPPSRALPARARPLRLDEEAREAISGAALVISALEGLPHRAGLLLSRAALATGVPIVFAEVDDEVIRIGPVQIARRTACYACARVERMLGAAASGSAAIDTLSSFSSGALGERAADRRRAGAAATAIVTLTRSLLGPDASSAGYATAALELNADGAAGWVTTHRDASCVWCGAEEPSPSPLERRSLFASVLSLDLEAVSRRGASFHDADGYRSVCILGGGTAGYLAALCLRARRPELDVTLIESSKIPILGVGEATTPLIVDFLHRADGLALDPVDFYRRVQPTWKLGIAFFWGLPGNYRFEFPFQFGSVTEPMQYQGNIDGYCLGAMLQAENKTPIFADGDGRYSSYLGPIPFAYHLDNRRFVKYLKEEALARGVRLLDREIADAIVSDDGERIARLVTADGESFEHDLYLDCSGFRSFLIEKKLGSKFVSYASSLFNDSAVMVDVPHGGLVKPYTLAESMDHGWCWNIPFEDSDHRGYVFCSAFASKEQAVAELARKNPGMGEPWSLKFRSGRHEHFFKGNVVALGNAYAFVEPLESTAIHMLIYELELLTKYFPASRHDEVTKRALSRKTNELWDNLRGFLAMHFRFNRKFDTAYWKECRSRTELGTAEERVALFRERAPLLRSSYLLGGADPFFGERSAADFFTQEYVYDVLLAGQQVPARWSAPAVSREAFRDRLQLMRRAVEHALPEADALRLLRERPEMVRATVAAGMRTE